MKIVRLFKAAIREWIGRDLSKRGAALAFYTTFAIAPLLVIVLAIAGFWFGAEAAHRELFEQLSRLVGEESARTIQALVSASNKPLEGVPATLIAVVTLLVGATGVFVQLQDALNYIWNVPRDSTAGWIRALRGRFMSFALIVAVGFLLLVSLILSAVLAALGNWVANSAFTQTLFWESVHIVVSFGVITVLFALIFKVLPDVRVSWRHAWRGALLTALMFGVGKQLFGLYLGRTGIASSYGAAGSLVVVLLWIYYSAQILLFGATITQLLTRRHREGAPVSNMQ